MSNTFIKKVLFYVTKCQFWLIPIENNSLCAKGKSHLNDLFINEIFQKMKQAYFRHSDPIPASI